MRSIRSVRSAQRQPATAATCASARRSKGTAERPRLVVFRSSKHIYAQLVDDDARRHARSARADTSEGVQVEGKGKVARSFALGPAHRREGRGQRHYEGRVRPRRLSVSRAREGRRRRRAQRRIGVLMADQRRIRLRRQTAPVASAVPAADVPAAVEQPRSSSPQRPVRGPGGRGGRVAGGGGGGRGRGGERRDGERGGASGSAKATDWSRTSIAINRVAKVVKGGRRFSLQRARRGGRRQGPGRHRDRQGERGERGGAQGRRGRAPQHGRGAARPAARSRTRSSASTARVACCSSPPRPEPASSPAARCARCSSAPASATSSPRASARPTRTTWCGRRWTGSSS